MTKGLQLRIDSFKRSCLAVGLLVGAGQLAVAQEGSVTPPKTTTTVVCASEGGTVLSDGNSIIAVKLAKGAEGWSLSGDFSGSEVLVKDQNRFTIVGPNFLVTVYHSRGAFIGVEDTISLFCKQILSDSPG